MARFALKPNQITAMQDVKRWHTRRTLREQSVAEHSHQVALLALYLAPDSTNNADRLQILELALVHDAHEVEFGDTPYPAKRLLEADDLDIDAHCRLMFWGKVDPYDQVPSHVRLLVDVADVLEAAIYAQRYLPEISAQVTQQAIKSAQELSHIAFVRALTALGQLEAPE